MPERKRRDGAGEIDAETERSTVILWPLGLVVFLVEVLVVPTAASPFRVPKMALALLGLALTLFVPAALALWAGAIPRIRSRTIWPILALPVLQLLSMIWATDKPSAAFTAAATAVWCVALLLLSLLGRKAITRLALWAAAGATLSAAVGLLQVLHLPLLAVEGEKGRMAITGLTGNPADLAMAALLLLPFVLSSPEKGMDGSSKIPFYMGVFLLASAVATQTLAALAAGCLVVFTRDWHPPRHASFTEQGGPWPSHCVSGSRGAAFHPALDVRPGDLVVSKAREEARDAYSAFEGTGLAGKLRAMGIERLLVGGLATEYCVRATVLDGLKEGFETAVLLGGIAGIEAAAGDVERALGEMEAAGAVLLG